MTWCGAVRCGAQIGVLSIGALPKLNLGGKTADETDIDLIQTLETYDHSSRFSVSQCTVPIEAGSPELLQRPLEEWHSQPLVVHRDTA